MTNNSQKVQTHIIQARPTSALQTTILMKDKGKLVQDFRSDDSTVNAQNQKNIVQMTF